MEIFNSHTMEDPLETITKKEYYKFVEDSIDKNLMKEKNYYLANDDLDEFLCNHTSMYESAEIKSYLNNTKRNKISSETLNSDIVNYIYGK